MDDTQLNPIRIIEAGSMLNLIEVAEYYTTPEGSLNNPVELSDDYESEGILNKPSSSTDEMTAESSAADSDKPSDNE